MNKIKKWLQGRKFFSSWLPEPKGVVSMDNLYWQIQKLMDEEGIGDKDLSVHVNIYGYSLSTDVNGVKRPPRKGFTVHMAGTLIAHDVRSPEIVMNLVRRELESRRDQKNAPSIKDITVQIEEPL